MSTSSTSFPRPPSSGPEALPEIVETSGEANVLHRGRLLYPERGPSRYAKRLAAAAERGPARLYLVASPCLWYGVRELLEAIDEDSALLCVETDPGLAALSRSRLPPDLASHPRFAFAEDGQAPALLGHAASLGTFRRALCLRLSGGSAFDEPAYEGMTSLLDGEFRSLWRNRATLLAMGRLWTRNIFRNLAAISELGVLPLAPTCKTVIVCGAGPSLEACLGFIDRHRSSLYVVAVDSALGCLVASGCVPDLVVCLEAQVHNLKDFLPLGSGRPAMVADLSTHPSTFRAFKGGRHLTTVAMVEGAFCRRLADSGLAALPCPPLGSVGVHAVHVARRLARGRIFVTGLDFAFEAGKTHARGTPALVAAELGQGRLRGGSGQIAAAFRPGARGIGGGLYTDQVLAGYATLLAEEASLPGPALLDLRGRGLPIGARALGLEAAEAAWGEAACTGGAGPEDEGLDPGAAPARPAMPGDREAATFDGRAFLSGELGRLVRIEACLKGREPATKEALSALVTESDFLLWPLPDRERLADCPQDLLNRILVEAEYWIWKIEELLSE